MKINDKSTTAKEAIQSFKKIVSQDLKEKESYAKTIRDLTKEETKKWIEQNKETNSLASRFHGLGEKARVLSKIKNLKGRLEELSYVIATQATVTEGPVSERLFHDLDYLIYILSENLTSKKEI